MTSLFKRMKNHLNLAPYSNWHLVGNSHYLYIGVRIVTFSLFTYTILITAWIGDDARLMLRELWNFVNGAGMTVNIGTRVQSFTNPLWFLILSGLISITRELYYTTIFTNISFSIAAILVMFYIERKLPRESQLLVSPAILFIFSWAFIDYTTSGLENSLSYFLIGIVFLFVASGKYKDKNSYLFFVFSLIALNRLDHAILIVPLALILLPYSKGIVGIFKVTYPAILAVFIWFGFATIYFGSTLPNTYYAKLNAGIPELTSMYHGVLYFFALKVDLVTLLILLLGNLAAFISKNRFLIALAIGQLLYMAYIIQAGGDFMQGRFFSALVYMSIGQFLLSLPYFRKYSFKDHPISYNIGFLLVIISLFVSGAFSNYPYLSSATPIQKRVNLINITDERAVWHQSFGLFTSDRVEIPEIDIDQNDIPLKYSPGCGELGKFLFEYPEKYWIDICALTDPFLARIPAIHFPDVPIGHYHRKIPTDYGEVVIGNIDKLSDSSLNELLRDVNLVARGNLFTKERFKAIWRLNTGYDYKIDENKYTDPSIWVPASTIPEREVWDNWKQPDRFRKFLNIFEVESKTPLKGKYIVLTTAPEYEFQLFANGIFLHEESKPESDSD